MSNTSKARYTVMSLDKDVIRITLSDRVQLIRNHQSHKDVGYVGFPTFQDADIFCTQLMLSGYVKYDHQEDCGYNRPRPSKRLTTAYEVKLHRPPVWVIEASLGLLPLPRPQVNNEQAHGLPPAQQAQLHDQGR